jgi:hypothetical protein
MLLSIIDGIPSTPHPFGGSKLLLASILNALRGLGVRSTVIDPSPDIALSAGTGREAACTFLSRLVRCCASKVLLHWAGAAELARVFIVLAVDKATSPALVMSVCEALDALWLVWAKEEVRTCVIAQLMGRPLRQSLHPCARLLGGTP